MKTGYRYEVKFVVDDIQLSEFYRWMWTALSVAEAYPGREINSLYFDDINYQSARDNIIGLPYREKYRLRWYEQTNGPEADGLKMEKKVRNGRVGYKVFRFLEHSKLDFLSHEVSRLSDLFHNDFESLGLMESSLLPHLIPVLQIRYFRNYYMDENQIRITVDDGIQFYPVESADRLSGSIPVRNTKKIIEVKFSPELKSRVSALFRTLHLMPHRCSKYLTGLAMTGSLKYL